MSYTIAFDVPESESPAFPRSYPTRIECALTQSLESATRFDTQAEAEAYLASDSVGWSLRPWGVVVEVGQ